MIWVSAIDEASPDPAAAAAAAVCICRAVAMLVAMLAATAVFDSVHPDLWLMTHDLFCPLPPVAAKLVQIQGCLIYLIRLVIICVPHVPKGAQASIAVVAACGTCCMFGQHGSSEAASQPALDLLYC